MQESDPIDLVVPHELAAQKSSLRAYVAIRSAMREGVMRALDIDDRALSRSLNFTRSAIRSALTTLSSEGFIQRKQRVGTTFDAALFDSNDDRAVNARDGGAGQVRIVTTAMETVIAPPWVRECLGIEGKYALLYECMSMMGDEPISVQLNYYPPDFDSVALFSRGLEIDEDDSYETLAERFRALLGQDMGRVSTAIEAVACDAQVATLLNVAEGAPILLREYHLRDVNDRVLVLSYSYARGDRVTVRTESHAS
ncbi:hypothetical protein B7R54_02630 [Subtercola boreus]|uniref:UbiC transcription regulator-associated domain-containing protein n=1 Tax=Subtercola boreus TaxID=120213 RepID=A0A3E0VEA8_9MICO|nr:GntR family transcriptional regulator [Subtercola boreus]RFA08242.1 hypothetical protein B7R54_02630 [Subtercola boreus]TQL54864.1 GntR family transcriptional regulator [Subtercola boreus]